MCKILLPCYKNSVSVLSVFSRQCQLLFFSLSEDLIGRNDTVLIVERKEQTLNKTSKLLGSIMDTRSQQHVLKCARIVHAQYETPQAIRHWPILI